MNQLIVLIQHSLDQKNNYLIINNEIKAIKIYTELLDKYTLEQIKNIGNTMYNDDSLINEDKPYIRKIKI